MSADTDSFLGLIDRLRQGDQEAADEVYHAYARRLIGLAHKRLAEHLRPKVDTDDIVQSVFRTFYRRCQTSEWDITSRNSLWALLAEITFHKCCRTQRRFHAGARDVRRESAPPSTESTCGWNVAGHEPTPDEAVELADVVERLMDGLPESERQIVQMRLEGYEIEEISEQTGISVRTIFRRLDRVRQRLEREVAVSTV